MAVYDAKYACSRVAEPGALESAPNFWPSHANNRLLRSLSHQPPDRISVPPSLCLLQWCWTNYLSYVKRQSHRSSYLQKNPSSLKAALDSSPTPVCLIVLMEAFDYSYINILNVSFVHLSKSAKSRSYATMYMYCSFHEPCTMQTANGRQRFHNWVKNVINWGWA